MFEFIHQIMERWILKASSKGLGGRRKKLLRFHMRHCWRCRSFSLDLVEFSHSMEDLKNVPLLSGQESDEIHSRVMAAFNRERLEERGLSHPFERASGPLVRASFLQALGLGALVLAALLVVFFPNTQNAPRQEANGDATTSIGEQATRNLDIVPTPVPVPSVPSPSHVLPIITPTP